MENILIIDDELEAAEGLGGLLDEYFNVQFANSLKSGIQNLENGLPGVVITDLNLMDGTGFEILEYLKVWPSVARVVITGFVKEFVQRIFNDYEIDGFLSKPISDSHKILNIVNSSIVKAKIRSPNNVGSPDNLSEILTIEDVSVILKVGRTTVFNLLKYEGLNSIKVGGNRRVLRSHLFQWLRQKEC